MDDQPVVVHVVRWCPEDGPEEIWAYSNPRAAEQQAAEIIQSEWDQYPASSDRAYLELKKLLANYRQGEASYEDLRAAWRDLNNTRSYLQIFAEPLQHEWKRGLT
jgi:hypothetical protein